MSSTLERIENLEKQVEMLLNRSGSTDPMVQMVINKAVGIEQAVTSMGKMLSAITEELSSTGQLDSLAVMTRLRKADDENGRQNIKVLLKNDVIEEVEVIDEMAMVVIGQKIINTETGETKVISEYNLIGMNHPMVNPVWKDSLLGKTKGETVKGMTGNNEEEVLTVLEIYGIKEKEVQGESEVNPVVSTEEATEQGEDAATTEESSEEISFG